MIKYYIEIYSKDEYANFNEQAILQSEWFSTKEEAISWFKKISFLQVNYVACLMSAEFEDEEVYNNIKVVEELRS